MSKVTYICHYCGHKFSEYIYSVDGIDSKCSKCKSKMTIKDIVPEIETDAYGYNKKKKT